MVNKRGKGTFLIVLRRRTRLLSVLIVTCVFWETYTGRDYVHAPTPVYPSRKLEANMGTEKSRRASKRQRQTAGQPQTEI